MEQKRENRVYRPRDEAAYTAQKKFLEMLLQPDKYLGLDMEDVRTHAAVSKISNLYIKLLVDCGASADLKEAMHGKA